MPVHQVEVIQAFRALDPFRVAELDFQPEDDLTYGVRAWEALSRGDLAVGEELLAAIKGDGTLHPSDLAFIKAFRAEADGDYQKIVDLLKPELGRLEGSIQNFRLYLRTADALMKMRQFEQVQEVLTPLTEAPGRTGTLEAMFIILQGMMATSVDKERLIEHVALIDGLLEKGFRLTESDNVIFYATWLEHHRIEPPVAPLLNSHAGMVEAFRTENRELIKTLLVMGDRHKAPCAVRAAGRNYARNPFPLEGIDPERAAYLFSSHEEHDAARQVILMGFPKSRIQKQQNLWGPLFLATYYAGRWKEALEIYREHRDELPRLKFYDNARAIRAVCEFQLRRFPEASKTIAELGGRFYDHTSGSEAVAHILTDFELKTIPEAIHTASRAFTFKKEDQEWVNEYATTVLSQLAVHELSDALNAWIDFLGTVLRRELKAEMLQRIGDMMVEWALPVNADKVVVELEKLGETNRKTLLEAFTACERGNADLMEERFAEVVRLYGKETPEFLLLRARCRRRLGLSELAAKDLDVLIANEAFSRRHAALGLREGMLREAGDHAGAVAARAAAGEHIRRAARNGDESTIMTYELNQLATGESAAAYLYLAQEAFRREPDSIEVLRLARKAARSVITTDEIRSAAIALQDHWEKANLLLTPRR